MLLAPLPPEPFPGGPPPETRQEAPPGMALLVAPPHALARLEMRLVLDALARDTDVLLVCGDNRLDAYALLAAARARGLEAAAAEGITLARAFTVHQLAALLVDDLPRLSREKRPGLALVTGLLDPFLDEDVRPGEAQVLLRRVLRALPGVEAPLVVSLPPGTREAERALAALVEAAVPRRVALPATPQARIESFFAEAA